MVPRGWEENTLLILLEKIIDYRGQSVPKAESGVPLITARNVRLGYLDFTSQEYVDEACYDDWMKRGIPRAGDILFTTEAPLGMVCRYPKTGKYAVGQRTVTLRASNKIDSEFLLYTLLSERGQRLIDIRSSGSTAKGIKSSELKKIKIAYPPCIKEQKKIAKILSTWDKAINTTQALIAFSKQQKKALMQQLLAGKKRFPEFDEKWERLPLKRIVSINYGKSPKGVTDKNGCFYIVGTSGVVGNANEYLCDKSAVIIGRKGTIDKPLFVEKPFWATDTTFYCLPVEKYIDIKWFYYLVKSFNFRKYNEASGVPSLSRETLYSIKVLVPQLLEQQAIATILFFSDKEIKVLQQKLDCLKQEKKSLMQQLLTGKRRVKIDEANMLKKEVSHD